MAPIFFISKPSTPFPNDYYYFKFKGYSILAQAVVDYKKSLLTFALVCQEVLMTHVYCIGLHYTSMDCLTSLGYHVKMEFLHISLVIKYIPLLIKSWCHLKKIDTITFYNYFTTKNTKRPIHGGECFWHSQEKFQRINV